jgi:hypothetical protein
MATIEYPTWPEAPPEKTAPLGQNKYYWERYADGEVHILWSDVHWHHVPLDSVRRAFHRYAERVGYSGRSAGYTFIHRATDEVRHALVVQLTAKPAHLVSVDEDTAEIIMSPEGVRVS